MNNNKFKLIYGEFSGIERKAVEFTAANFMGELGIVIPTEKAENVAESDLKGCNLIVVGTVESNCILKTLSEKGFYKPNCKKEGYSIKIADNPYDGENKIIIVCGSDDNGTLYGAAELIESVIPYLDNIDAEQRYPDVTFDNEFFKDYEVQDSPSFKMRGIWSWGHVVYDYRRYIENMAHLKMNTLILWNDHVPLNIDDVIEEAHSWGIKIYLGFSWGWNEARPENGGLDISDEDKLLKIQDSIIENYKNNYRNLDIDGIYFQSFTETEKDEINHVVIAERVVKFVNDTAEKILSISPNLAVMFGLHASSVSDKIEYIKKTDKRVMIVWEDAGAFPYSYTPRKLEDYDKTVEFSAKIAVLRGGNERFGVVTKGLTCLDWLSFSHLKGEFVMGKQQDFRERRTREKEKLWKYIDAYWVKNAKYAYDVFKALRRSNPDTMVTALIEDGMFEEEIHKSAAIFAGMLWDTESDVDELVLKASIRNDVK